MDASYGIPCRSKKEQSNLRTGTWTDLKITVLSKKLRDQKDLLHSTIFVNAPPKCIFYKDKHILRT